VATKPLKTIGHWKLHFRELVLQMYRRTIWKEFSTRLLSRGAAITDVQHLLGHASVKTTEKVYAAFVKNERFKQTIDLLDKLVWPRLKVVE
jgi:integrase